MKKWFGWDALKKTFAKFFVGLFVLQSFAFAVPTAMAYASITVGSSPVLIAVTPDGAKAYVSDQGGTTVSVIDTATDTVTATVTVGTSPFGILVTPDGAKAYVANFDSSNVSVIDTSTDTVVATVSVGTSPSFVAATPDSAKVYVTNGSGNSVSVIDTSTDTVVATVPIGGYAFGVTVTPDGTKAYAVNTAGTVSAIDTATDTVVATIPVGTGAYFVAVTPDGTKAYVTNNTDFSVSVIDTATDTVSATIPVGVLGGPYHIAVTPDGTKAYATNFYDHNVSVIDTDTDTVLTDIPVGDSPYFVAVTPDGTKALVTNNGDATVSVIDTSTDAVIATATAGSGPFGITITPNGAKIYVANSGGTTVTAFGANGPYSMPPPSGPTPNTTDNSVTLSRIAVNATAAATIHFVLNDTLSSQLTVTFDPAFSDMDVSGASAMTPGAPGCMSNFVATNDYTFTADKSSCTGEVIITGVTVTNPSTPDSYLVSWTNDDDGYAMVAIVDDDQVTVMAQVDPSITFDLDTGIAAGETSAPYNVALGPLTIGAVAYSDNSTINSIFAQLDTNATGGAQVTVLSANAALASASAPSDTIPNFADTMAAGVANYGICVENVTGPTSADGVFQASSPYDFGTCDPTSDANDVQELSMVIPTTILDSGFAPVTSGEAEIIVNAAIDTSTAAHSDYTDTLTFVATGTF